MNFLKEVQAENIKELLSQIPHTELLVFTDGSALTNPIPTGGSAMVYLDGPTRSPVCVKKRQSSCSNNYTGELVGIQLGVNFLNRIDFTDRPQSTAHFFCQTAITAVFL